MKVIAYNDGHISWLPKGYHEGVLLQNNLVGYSLVKVDSTEDMLIFEAKHVHHLAAGE